MLTYEEGTHLIAFSHAAEIQAETADRIFEQVLWPLGYRAGGVTAAA